MSCGSVGYLSDFHTVYVMVDNRDLANHQRQDPSLPHWPAAARWWHSRLKLMGPHKEKTELLLFPISESTGLHHVHPTWAGTFVLAALVAVFPGINFVLLDSDCLPVTLFEVEDLWTEAYLARFPAHGESGIPQAHPLRALARYSNDPKVVYTQSRVSSTRMGQAALVVSEPHAELNAGLIVIFRSSHPSLFDWNAWSLRLRSFPRFNHRGCIQRRSLQLGPLLFGTEWVSSSSDHALAVSSVLMRRRSGYNQA